MAPRPQDLRLPEHSRPFVDAATCGLRRFAERGGRWELAFRREAEDERAARGLARECWIDPTKAYAEAQIDNDRIVMARLGHLPVTVRTEGMISPLGQGPIETLPMDARWLPTEGRGGERRIVDVPRDEFGAVIAEVVPAERAGNAWRLRIAGALYLYSERGLDRLRA